MFSILTTSSSALPLVPIMHSTFEKTYYLTQTLASSYHHMPNLPPALKLKLQVGNTGSDIGLKLHCVLEETWSQKPIETQMRGWGRILWSKLYFYISFSSPSLLRSTPFCRETGHPFIINTEILTKVMGQNVIDKDTPPP